MNKDLILNVCIATAGIAIFDQGDFLLNVLVGILSILVVRGFIYYCCEDK